MLPGTKCRPLGRNFVPQHATKERFFLNFNISRGMNVPKLDQLTDACWLMPTISSHHCSPVAMAKAVKKIDHLKLPPPPPIKEFLASISRLKDGQYGAEQYNAGSNEDGVFMGEFFDDGELDDYAVGFTVEFKCLQFFLEAADLLKFEFNSCDDFFLAWSRFVLSEHSLKDLDHEKEEILQYRQSIGAALQVDGKKIKIYRLTPKSFITYLNAIMNIYNQREPKKLYPNSQYTLPKFYRFASAAVRRYRFWWLQQNPHKQETPPLTEQDLLTLWKATNFNCYASAQVYRFCLVSNKGGLRACYSPFPPAFGQTRGSWGCGSRGGGN